MLEKKAYFPWLVWFLGAAFFFIEYFARVDSGVIVDALMREFRLNAEQIGVLSAFFYYPYIIMQIPVGSLMDHFGPRRLLTITAGLCAIASFLFAFTHVWWMIAFSRALLGFSAAFAFVGTLKIVTIWFEPKVIGLLSGLTQGVGMLGAMVGVAGFAVLSNWMGWRDTVSLIGVVLIALAICIALIVPDRRLRVLNKRVEQAQKQPMWKGLKKVLCSRNNWLVAIYAGLLYAPSVVLGELWGTTYLSHVYHVNVDLAALAVSLIFLGFAVGGPLFGAVSDALQKRRVMMFSAAFMALIFLMLILYVSHLPYWVLCLLFFLYGMANTGVSLSYAVSAEIQPREVAGVSMAFTNMGSVIIGAILQQILGALLQHHGVHTTLHGLPNYTAADYQHAVLLLPLTLILACITVFFIRDIK